MKKHQWLLFLMALLALPSLGKAQVYAEMRWHLENIDYKAFIIHYSEEDILVRVAYQDKIAEFEAKGHYIKRYGGKYYHIDGQDNTVRMVMGKAKYLADNFLIGKDSVFHRDEANNRGDKIAFKFLKQDDLGLMYLLQFFAPDDPVCQKLLNNSTTADMSATNGIKKPSTVHAIVVGNSFSGDKGKYDQNFSEAIDLDVQRFRELFEGLTSQLGIPFNFQELRDAQATPEAVNAMIASLNLQPNDAVIFLYRGHGFRWFDQKSEYPRMDLRTDRFHDLNQSLNIYEDILLPIQQKAPKLCVVLGDLCNTQQMRPMVPMMDEMPVLRQEEAHFNPELALRLLTAKGYGIAVSARKGQVSYADPDLGGYFSKSFFDAFNQEISKTKGKGDWNKLIRRTMNWAEKLSISKNKPGQEGSYDMKNIEYEF